MELNLFVQRGEREREEKNTRSVQKSSHSPDYELPKCGAYTPRLGQS